MAEFHGLPSGVGRRMAVLASRFNEPIVKKLVDGALEALVKYGVAYEDIDVVWVAGYGFPDHRGGPMFMADQIGLATIADRLAHYAKVRGNPFGYWTPSPLLTRLASSKQTLAGWQPR